MSNEFVDINRQESEKYYVKNENLINIENGTVSDIFRAFLRTLNIEIPVKSDNKDDLRTLNDILQARFVRQVRGEAFSLVNSEGLHPTEQQQELLKQLGVVEAVPLPPVCDTVIVHGATMPAVAHRLNFLKEKIRYSVINTGVVYISVSKRKLREDSTESLKSLIEKVGIKHKLTSLALNKVHTEYEAAKALFLKMKFLDKNGNKIKIEFVEVPDMPNSRFANTPYSMEYLFGNYGHKMGSKIVSLSSQPYVVNQDGITQWFFKDKNIIPAGPALETTKTIAFYANALSRMFYDVLNEPN